MKVESTTHLTRMLKLRGYKGLQVSVKKLKELGFSPAFEMAQGTYWKLEDLERAADIIMREPKEQPKLTIQERLDYIEHLLETVVFELRQK